MESPVNSNMDNHDKQSEELFKSILNPIEPAVMQLQSLLVWEKPPKSVVLFILVHLIFWFFAAVGCQVYFLISTTLIVSYFVRTWKRRIWPEIRVPPKEPEDSDGWTPVHPRLLSVPEISKYLAQIWCFIAKSVQSWMSFRRNHRFFFCVVSSCVFISLAFLGHYIPGIMLSYITVISIMLWPCVLYHNLLQRLYLKVEPVFMKLDYTLKLRSKWSFKGKQYQSKDARRTSAENGTTDSDSDDFCPSLDPIATAALARSITDSEDESGGTPSLFTPMLSKEPSFSDDHESHDEDFTPDLGNMPSIDHLDDTDDEILAPRLPKLSNKNTRENDSMNFISSHFGDTSDSEDDTITRDLKFPDIHEMQSPEPSQPVFRPEEAGLAMLASNLVSQTFSSMMQSAMSGLNMATKSPEQGRGTVQNEPNVTMAEDNNAQRKVSCDSDVDITDEFEFLDQYDIDDTEETK